MTDTTDCRNETEIISVVGQDNPNLNKPSSSEEKILVVESALVQGSSVPNSTTMPNKPKKRKKVPRDETAPKPPLTGYLRFLRDRRDNIRAENPTMPFVEITKALALEWNVLPSDQKQQYLEAAERDKERYIREFNDYKQTEAYRTFCEKQKEYDAKKRKIGMYKNDDPENNCTFDIPIFTKEFLEHNKACEVKLRQLRKAISDFEAQNGILQRHVDNLHAAVERLEADTQQQRAANQALQGHLDLLLSHLMA